MKTCNGRAIGLLVGKKVKTEIEGKGRRGKGIGRDTEQRGGRTIMPVEVRGDVVSCEWGWQIYIMVKPPWEKRTNTGILSGKMSNPP